MKESEDRVDMSSVNQHVCPSCGHQRLQRIERRTFLERMIYPFAGLYPWVCKGCRTRVLLRDRGSRRAYARNRGRDVPKQGSTSHPSTGT